MFNDIMLQHNLPDTNCDKRRVLQQRPSGFSTERRVLKLHYCLWLACFTVWVVRNIQKLYWFFHFKLLEILTVFKIV